MTSLSLRCLLMLLSTCSRARLEKRKHRPGEHALLRVSKFPAGCQPTYSGKKKIAYPWSAARQPRRYGFDPNSARRDKRGEAQRTRNNCGMHGVALGLANERTGWLRRASDKGGSILTAKPGAARPPFRLRRVSSRTPPSARSATSRPCRRI